jgi:hypothetical protein
MKIGFRFIVFILSLVPAVDTPFSRSSKNLRVAPKLQLPHCAEKEALMLRPPQLAVS